MDAQTTENSHQWCQECRKWLVPVSDPICEDCQYLAAYYEAITPTRAPGRPAEAQNEAKSPNSL